MIENNTRYILAFKNITYVIFCVLSVAFTSSCASNSGQVKEIESEIILASSNTESTLSFDEEITPYEVLEEEAEVFIGERIDRKPIQETDNETIRFVFLDENGNEIRQSVKKQNPKELLETQFESSIESISSRRDFFNSIVEYTYSDGKVYDIVASPISVTDIRLEGEETLFSNIAIGEAEGWTIDTLTSVENGHETLHFLVRAEEEKGETLLIVPTNRRTYYFRLIATEGRSMVGVRFKYKNRGLTLNSTALPSGNYKSADAGRNMYDVDARNLFFNYRIESNSDIAPVSVFSDSKSTFFQFDPRFEYKKSAPSLYLKRANKLELINYTIRGNLYTTATLIGENESFVFIEGEARTEVFKEEQ